MIVVFFSFLPFIDSVIISLFMEADSDSDTTVEASPATMESELSLPKAKNSPFYELVDYIYKKYASI